MAQNITIVGAGIGGLTAALALKQRGCAVTIFESAHEIKPVGAGIIMANNAMQILKKLGVERRIQDAGQKVSIMSITDEKLNSLCRMDISKYENKYGAFSVAIHRAELQRILAEEVGYENIVLSKRLLKIEQDENITLNFGDGTVEQCANVVAADGIHSITRNQLFSKSEIRDTQQVCWRGVVECALPEKYMNTIVEAWGKGKRFGFVKISSEKIYWFAVLNASMLKEGNEHIQNYFSEFHEVVVNMIDETSPENIIYTKLTDLQPIDKWYKRNVCLLGDSAHASTPNMGQGACQAVEDAYALASAFSPDKPIEQIFQEYESMRIHKAHDITTKSWEMGKTGHIDSDLGVRLRNGYMRTMGRLFIDRQLEEIFNIEFDSK